MKLVELLIDELIDFHGFDAISLVKNPAIEAPFHAFNSDEFEDAVAYQILKAAIKEHMVEKLPGESQEDYMGRCIPKLKSEGYDQDQSVAICIQSYKFDETEDPQEIVIGDYQTRHYDMCPGATALYKKIESQELDVDMGMAIRAAKLQDALFYLEKHTVKEMQHASFEDVKAAEILAEEIMTLARMMDLEEEHQYIAGHVDAIRSLYLQGDQEELDIDVSSLPDYVVEVSGSIVKEKFASYDDYPQAASDNACKALRWIEEHGRDEVQAATRVGITRANQLCSRRPLSEDTISRMAAFERHRRNAEIDPDLIGTPWKDKGYVSWLMWGGDEGVAWAQRKLARIRQEQELAKMEFSVDEEQQIIVGPALIPNKEIYRVDENGEPYYAFFSEDTVRKIAYKMLKDKKVDKLNLEHNDSDRVDGYLLESWIVEDPANDKQQFYGMNHPKGSWITMYKIEDQDAWKKVRSGEVTGLSIEAYLMDRLVKR